MSKITNQQRFDSYDQQLGELASLPSRVESLEAYIQSFELEELVHRVEALESLTHRVRALERSERPPVTGENHPHTSSVAPGEEHTSAPDNAVAELTKIVNDLSEDVAVTVDTLKREIADLSTKVNVTMVAIGNPSPPSTGMDYGRIKVPEPRAYGGARDAKELENFLFDMEQYFQAVKTESEETKVVMATMYLTGDAKLWWRTKYNDIQEKRCIINSWQDLKKELKAQFLPENVDYIARRNLRELKQTGTIRDYVKAFSALMLDIRDMSEKDKLFYFLEGLKPWARMELHRQRVLDLATAQSAAERLTDYTFESTLNKKSQTNAPNTSGMKPFKPNQTKSGGGDRRPPTF